MQENAALIGGLPMPRVELKSMLKAQERIGRPIERDKNAAGMLPQVGIVRPELHRLVEHVARVVEAPHLLQGDPERRKIVRLASLGVGSLPDSAREPFHRVIILPGLQRQQAHEVQGVRMPRIDRQRLLAAGLSIQMPPGAQMRNAGLIERGNRGRGLRVLIRPSLLSPALLSPAPLSLAPLNLGALAGGPALATVHQPISMRSECRFIGDSEWARKIWQVRKIWRNRTAGSGHRNGLTRGRTKATQVRSGRRRSGS